MLGRVITLAFAVFVAWANEDALVLLQTQAKVIKANASKPVSAHHHHLHQPQHQQHQQSQQEHQLLKKSVYTASPYGDDSCKCVAIEGLTGTIDVTIENKTIKDLYPADIGSSCSAWDDGKYPGSCDAGTPEDWCSEKWCYVDPCDCDIGTNPSSSYYLSGATYDGKQIFYSYATCGAKNYFNEPPATAVKDACSTEWDEDTYGLEECSCVGMNGLSGTTDVVIADKTVSDLYPADLGSACAAWDENTFPASCTGKDPEEWCSQKWCYVSKDNCKVSKGPFPSYYLADGKFQGQPLYYSYTTCGGTNSFDPESIGNISEEAVNGKSSASGLSLSLWACVALAIRQII